MLHDASVRNPLDSSMGRFNMFGVSRIQLNDSQERVLANARKLSAYLISLASERMVVASLSDLAEGVGGVDPEDIRLAAAVLMLHGFIEDIGHASGEALRIVLADFSYA